MEFFFYLALGRQIKTNTSNFQIHTDKEVMNN